MSLFQEFDLIYIEKMSVKSQKEYRNIFSQFIKFLDSKDVKIENIKPVDLGLYLKLKKKSCKNSTLRRHYFAIKGYYKFLMRKGILDLNEYTIIDEDMKIKKEVGDKPGKSLTEKEISYCLEKITHPIFRFMFLLGIWFGLRCEEYTHLKLSDIRRYIDLDDGKEKARLRVTGKGMKFRFIPITANQLTIINDFQRYRELDQIEHEYLLYSKTGKMIDRTIQKYFEEIREICEIFFTSHDLRRTYCTRSYFIVGIDIYLISQYMGHASVNTTKSYLRLTDKMMEERYLEKAESFY